MGLGQLCPSLVTYYFTSFRFNRFPPVFIPFRKTDNFSNMLHAPYSTSTICHFFPFVLLGTGCENLFVASDPWLAPWEMWLRVIDLYMH